MTLHRHLAPFDYERWSDDLDRTIKRFNEGRIYNPGYRYYAERHRMDEVAIFLSSNDSLYVILDCDAEPDAFDTWLAELESTAVADDEAA